MPTTVTSLDRPTDEIRRDAAATMQAVVYHGVGQRRLEARPRPNLVLPTDAIVRITTTTICGTDLHILKGDVPEVQPGRILGHEGVGIVEEVGSAVSGLYPGNRVLISCITSCGKCVPCRKGMYSHCDSGGWALGHTIDGTQAEFVRIPHAETSLHVLPEDVDEEAAVLLSDIFPTGFECGVLNGRVKPGDNVAIIGAGPIGLATLLTAQLYSPARIIMVDFDEFRLREALALGASHVVNSGKGKTVSRVLSLTDGAGVDVAIEAVGTPESFDVCQQVVAAGGVIANVGVHGKPVSLELDRLWSRNITLTTRLVDTVTTPMLLKLVRLHRFPAEKLVTHRFRLADAMAAYDVFGDAAKVQALKVVMRTT